MATGTRAVPGEQLARGGRLPSKQIYWHSSRLCPSDEFVWGGTKNKGKGNFSFKSQKKKRERKAGLCVEIQGLSPEAICASCRRGRVGVRTQMKGGFGLQLQAHLTSVDFLPLCWLKARFH